MEIRGPALIAAIGLLSACGPGESAASASDEGSEGSESGESSESGDPDDGPPALVATFAPGGCDGVGQALPLSEGGLVVVGDSALVDGWIARFDDELALVWRAESSVVYDDVGLGLDDSLWVAAGGWGQPATTAAATLTCSSCSTPAAPPCGSARWPRARAR